jgi:hypothetical protein
MHLGSPAWCYQPSHSKEQSLIYFDPEGKNFPDAW